MLILFVLPVGAAPPPLSLALLWHGVDGIADLVANGDNFDPLVFTHTHSKEQEGTEVKWKQLS